MVILSFAFLGERLEDEVSEPQFQAILRSNFPGLPDSLFGMNVGADFPAAKSFRCCSFPNRLQILSHVDPAG